MNGNDLTINRDMSQYTILGGWSTRFAVYAPLNPTHIKNTEELLGWKYIDGKAQEK